MEHRRLNDLNLTERGTPYGVRDGDLFYTIPLPYGQRHLSMSYFLFFAKVTQIFVSAKELMKNDDFAALIAKIRRPEYYDEAARGTLNQPPSNVGEMEGCGVVKNPLKMFFFRRSYAVLLNFLYICSL